MKRWQLLALVVAGGLVAWWLLRSRSEGGIPGAEDEETARESGFGVIPDLLEDFARRMADEPADLPAGAVELGGDRTLELSHQESFDQAPAPVSAPVTTTTYRAPRAPAPAPTPIYGKAVLTSSGYVKPVIGYK